MIKLGYALSSEEHDPQTMVNNAQRAEEAGFSYAFISDHFHPWIDVQGHSPFVWSVIGGISQRTSVIKIATGVTCPIIRIHPAIIAQAAATCELMLPGRFMLGLGTGENLNEHITGEGWPPIDVRLDMLAESIDIIRTLWQGKNTTYYGDYFTVEDARIYSCPKVPPPILIASSGEKSAKLTGELGDGIVSTSADKKVVKAFEQAGGKGKPKYGQFAVCYDLNEQRAIETAYKYWPTAAFTGQLSQELRIPAYFEQTAEMIKPEDVARHVICGSNKEAYLAKIAEYEKAGFEYIYIHQIGPDQEAFLRFAEKELLPEFN